MAGGFKGGLFSMCTVHTRSVPLEAGCQYVEQSWRALAQGFFFFFYFADEFAGVWAVASVALRGPAIYQAEAESAGIPKGKKHGLLYRLTPLLPSYSCALSLFYRQPSVASLSQSDMLFRAVFLCRRGLRGVTKGQKGVRRENKKDWMWLTVFPMTPSCVIANCMKKCISSYKHLAPDVVFKISPEIVESWNADWPRALQESASTFLERLCWGRGEDLKVWFYPRRLQAMKNSCVICFCVL